MIFLKYFLQHVTNCFSASTVNFEQVNTAGWAHTCYKHVLIFRFQYPQGWQLTKLFSNFDQDDGKCDV